MSRIYSREGKGLLRLCGLCGVPFTVGKTFLYCSSCSFAIQPRNYPKLSGVQKKLLHKYNWRHGGKKYSNNHRNLDYALAYAKKWRRNNPGKKYIQKKRETDRYNEESLSVADNHHQRWTSDEIAYIKEYGRDKTARTLALDLGRTYNAIIVRACIENISLMTEDKKHMRLVTR